MPADNIIVGVYGLFLLVGAFMGWKAGSKISLIMGIVSGTLILLGVLLITLSPQAGWVFTTLVNGLLVLAFIKRLLKTKKFMPAGLFLFVSFLATIFCAIHLLRY